MIFNQPCFIRLNNPEIIKKLEELGYDIWSVDKSDCGLTASMYNYRITSESMPDVLSPVVVGVSDSDDFEDLIDAGFIDCDENINLFLAIAAMTDETDRNQYFIYNGDDTPDEVYCSKLVKCELDDWDSDFNSWMANDDLQSYMFRKATVNELIDLL